MAPFNVMVEAVADHDLARLLNHIAEAGFREPRVFPADPDAAAGVLSSGPSPPTPSSSSATPEGDVAIPEEWRVVAERSGVTYAWPKSLDTYDRYRLFAGTTDVNHTVHIGYGETHSQRWGQQRRRSVAFLTSSGPQQPLAEFVGADDYDSTRELLSVIRGKGGTGQMYGASDSLPDVYTDGFKTALYSDRVHARGVWRKYVVVVHEDDIDLILRHALIQGRRREIARDSRGSKGNRRG
jgi:hypothetical protein